MTGRNSDLCSLKTRTASNNPQDLPVGERNWLTEGRLNGENEGPHEVTLGTRFPHFNRLLRVHYCCFARRRSCVARSSSAHCADISALDSHRPRHSPLGLDQVGGSAVLFLLADADDLYLAVPARLGADRLGDILANRDSNDGDRWVGCSSGNC